VTPDLISTAKTIGSSGVIAGLDPAIHHCEKAWSLMDARVKPAHDESAVAVLGMTVAACCRCSGAISA
jgi:hypothetical protein